MRRLYLHAANEFTLFRLEEALGATLPPYPPPPSLPPSLKC